MSPVYHPQTHSHVQFPREHPLRDDGAPCPILLHTGDRVWVVVDYSQDVHCGVLRSDSPALVVRVTDGMSQSQDAESGAIVVSVLAAGCSYCDEDEAASIEACIDADRSIGP